MSSSPKMNRSGFVRAEENVQPNDSPAPRAAPRRRAAAAARRAAQTSAKSARKSSGSGPGSRGGKRGKDNSKRASKAAKKAAREAKKPKVCWSKRSGRYKAGPKNSKGQFVRNVAKGKNSYKNKPNGARAANDAKRAAGRQLPQVIAKMCAMEEWRIRMRFKRKGGFRVKNFAYCAVQMCIDCGWFKDQDLTPDKIVKGRSHKCWHVVKMCLIKSGFTCDHDFNKVKYSDDLTITFTHKDFLEGEDDKIASIVQKKN